jgi:hypothetical protein
VATLSKTQRNDVLARVMAAGLDPRDFVWVERKTPEWTGWNGYTADTLVHKPTSYHSMFFAPGALGLGYLSNVPQLLLTQPGEYVVAFEPGTASPRGKVVGVAWPNVLDAVALWLACVKREHEAPDLWAQMEQQRRWIGDVVEQAPDNAPFGSSELVRVADGLKEIRRAAQTLQLEASEIERLEAGIVYVQQAAERKLGRKDWFLLACAVLMWAVPPDKAVQIVQSAVQVLQWAVQTQHLLR